LNGRQKILIFDDIPANFKILADDLSFKGSVNYVLTRAVKN
jgi:hypothetical protein